MIQGWFVMVGFSHQLGLMGQAAGKEWLMAGKMVLQMADLLAWQDLALIEILLWASWIHCCPWSQCWDFFGLVVCRQ